MEKRKFGERKRERKDRDRDRDFAGPKKRSARFILPEGVKIDYKNLPLLEKFITDSGKIVPRRITGVTGNQNRLIEMAVKRARYLGLLSGGAGRRS